MHSIDYRSVGLEDFGKPTGYVTRQVARWSKQYVASSIDDTPAMNRLIEWLPANMPAQDESHPSRTAITVSGNLLFHPTQSRVVAVLDWELSTIGHPLGDLGYNCMMYHFGEGFGASGGYAGIDFKAFGIPSEAEYLAAYARRTGRTEVPSWDFYLAFSLFRLAAIVQGVYKRGLDGNASSETATKYGNRAKAMADLAWSIVEKRA